MMKINQKAAGLLPRSGVARGVIALASATAVGQIITAGAMPLVTRLYTPSQVGVISLFIAFFTFWSSLLSLRYESALLVAESDVETHLIFNVGWLCVAVMSVLALPILTILRVGNILGFSLLPWWSGIIAIPIMYGYGKFMMYRSWGLRGGLIKDISSASIARSAANAAVRIALGLIGWGVPGLFVAELAGAWGPEISMRRAINSRFAESRPSVIHWPNVKMVMLKYLKFAKYEAPSTAFNQMALAMPVPMVAALYGSSAAGWYGLARMLVAIPNAQIGKAVADVLQMRLAESVREQKFIQARKLFFKFLRQLSLLGLVPLAGVMILGPWLVPLVFGRGWAQMGVISACIAPWLYASLVVTSLSRALSVLQAQQYKLIYDLFSLAMMLAIYFFSKASSMGLLPMITVMTAGYVVSYCVYLVVLVMVVNKELVSK
jgi:O-antigen/teichoic acid export membrane protein